MHGEHYTEEVGNAKLKEEKRGNNFSYILSNNDEYHDTAYKVLHSQENGMFLPCMKMYYNGKIEIYYMCEGFETIDSIRYKVNSDTMIEIILNFIKNITEFKSIGFLYHKNIQIAWDKIYIEQNTHMVKWVYIPITQSEDITQSAFETEIRAELIRYIHTYLLEPNQKVQKLMSALANGSMNIQDIYNEYRGATKKKVAQNKKLKMVGLPPNDSFSILLEQEKIVLGKQKELVDIVIANNNTISRKHCTIMQKNGELYIVDEGSVNGTYVNSIKVEANQMKQIGAGDIIRLANTKYQIV